MATRRASVKTPVDMDWTEVEKLVADLKLIRSRMQPALRQATVTSAKHVRDAAKANIKSQTKGVHTKWFPSTITYEVRVATAALVLAEVGPEKRRKQGFLATFLEFGSVNNAPKPYLMPAMHVEIDPYEKGIGDAAEQAVLG